MIRNLVLLALVFFPLVSAGAEGGRFFPSPRSYLYDIFFDPQKCEQFQHQGGNCFQSLQLDPDGRATLIVTDIMNPGHYFISGRKVFLTFEGPGEVPQRISFTVSTNGKF